MVAIAIVADRTLKQIQSSSAALRSELLLREGLLDRLRLDLYRSSIDIHDYLIEPDPAQARRRRRELERLRNETTAVLSDYRHGLPDEEAAPVAELEQDMVEYWKALQPIFRAGIRRRCANRETPTCAAKFCRGISNCSGSRAGSRKDRRKISRCCGQ